MNHSSETANQVVAEHALLIQAAVLSVLSGNISPQLEGYLQLAESNGWDNLVPAIKAIVAGERQLHALANLDEEDAIIVENILYTITYPAEIAGHLLTQSIGVLRGGDLAQSETLAKAVCELQPDNATAFAQLGFVSAMQGRLDAAEVAYTRSLALNPAQPTVCLNLGVILQDLNRPEEAIKILEDAVRMQPDHLDAVAHLAYLYEKTDSLEKSQTLVQQGLLTNSGHAALRFIEGKLYRRNGDIEGAIDSLEIALNANLPKVLVDEATALLNQLKGSVNGKG